MSLSKLLTRAVGTDARGHQKPNIYCFGLIEAISCPFQNLMRENFVTVVKHFRVCRKCDKSEICRIMQIWPVHVEPRIYSDKVELYVSEHEEKTSDS